MTVQRSISTPGSAKGLRLRRSAAVAVLALGVSGLTACAEDPAGPVEGAATVDDLEGVEQRVGDLEERVGLLEEGLLELDEEPTPVEEVAGSDAPVDPTE